MNQLNIPLKGDTSDEMVQMQESVTADDFDQYDLKSIKLYQQKSESSLETNDKK